MSSLIGFGDIIHKKTGQTLSKNQLLRVFTSRFKVNRVYWDLNYRVGIDLLPYKKMITLLEYTKEEIESLDYILSKFEFTDTEVFQEEDAIEKIINFKEHFLTAHFTSTIDLSNDIRVIIRCGEHFSSKINVFLDKKYPYNYWNYEVGVSHLHNNDDLFKDMIEKEFGQRSLKFEHVDKDNIITYIHKLTAFPKF